MHILVKPIKTYQICFINIQKNYMGHFAWFVLKIQDILKYILIYNLKKSFVYLSAFEIICTTTDFFNIKY